MKKILLVIGNEIVMIVFRRSFILTLILVPLVPFLIIQTISQLEKKKPGVTSDTIVAIFNPASRPVVEGYVDPGKLIRALPPDVQGRLLDFDSEAAARQAMQSGEIKGFYLLPADYVASGRIVYVRQEYNPVAGMIQSGDIKKVLDFNLVGGNSLLARRLENPINLEVTYLSGQKQRDPNNALTFLLPYGLAFMYYSMILTTASLAFFSINGERGNRLLEILITSVTPSQILVGKIVAIGIIGLSETMLWNAVGIGLLRLSGEEFHLPAIFQLPFSLLAWGAVYFVLGYALYALLMACIGVLAPNLREASQLTTIISLPLLVPFILIGNLGNQPNSTLALVMGLIPFTAPVTMIARLSASNVPLWQLALSVGLLLLSSALAVRAVAALFKSQNLLAEQKFRLIPFIKALMAKP